MVHEHGNATGTVIAVVALWTLLAGSVYVPTLGPVPASSESVVELVAEVAGAPDDVTALSSGEFEELYPEIAGVEIDPRVLIWEDQVRSTFVTVFRTPSLNLAFRSKDAMELSTGIAPLDDRPYAWARRGDLGFTVSHLFSGDRVVFIETYSDMPDLGRDLDLPDSLMESLDGSPVNARYFASAGPPGYAVGTAAASLVVLLFGVRWLFGWRRRRRERILGIPDVAIDVSVPASQSRRRGRVLRVFQASALLVGAVSLAAQLALQDLGYFPTFPGSVLTASAVAVFIGVIGTRFWVAMTHATAGSSGRISRRIGPVVTKVIAIVLAGIGVLLLGMAVAAVSGWSEFQEATGIDGYLPRGVPVTTEEAEVYELVVSLWTYLRWILALILFAVSAALVRFGRSIGQARADEVRSIGEKSVLFLRSFQDDRLRVTAIPSGRQGFLDALAWRWSDRFEEVVAAELMKTGPVTAVSPPGGSLRSLGAAREHLEGDRWESEIVERMKGSALIVLSTGRSGGLLHEVGLVKDNGFLDKTIIVAPPTRPSETAERWSYVFAALGVEYELAEWGSVLGVYVPTPTQTPTTVTASRRDEAGYREVVRYLVSQVEYAYLSTVL